LRIYGVRAAGAGQTVSVTVLAALLMCLAPTTVGGRFSARGTAGMDRVIQNLLEMPRLQAGALKAHKEPQPLEEVTGSALGPLSASCRAGGAGTRASRRGQHCCIPDVGHRMMADTADVQGTVGDWS